MTILKFRGNNKIIIYEVKETTLNKNYVNVRIKNKVNGIESLVLKYNLNLMRQTAIAQIKKMVSDVYILEHEITI